MSDAFRATHWSAGICAAYVEFFRNIPVLLQLLMWYLMFTEVLPASNEPWVLGPFFLSKGGINFPIPRVGARACLGRLGPAWLES